MTRRRRGARSRGTKGEATRAEDFEPSIRAGIELPAEVLAAREMAERQAEGLEKVLRPRIEGHLVTYRTVLDVLIDTHTQIAETMDFGIGGRTRWTAVWEMSGRCLGLCNALLAVLGDGFASEAVPTMRSIHEAGQLLSVVAGPGETNLLRRWLDNGYIGAAKARAAEVRIDKPAVEALREQGIELHGDPKELGDQIYDVLSKPAHNMRVGFRESISVDLRRFSYGSHPDPGQQAVHVEYGGQLIEEVTLRIGSSFATRFLGRDFYETTIKPLLASLHAIRDEMPIDPPTVNRLRAQFR